MSSCSLIAYHVRRSGGTFFCPNRVRIPFKHHMTRCQTWVHQCLALYAQAFASTRLLGNHLKGEIAPATKGRDIFFHHPQI